jgi:hypothetical protein
MGKKRTCIFPYKSVPPQQVPYTLTVARRFQAQSTSVNICEGEGKCDDSTGGIWVFDPGSLWGCLHTGRALPSSLPDRQSRCAGGDGPHCRPRFSIRGLPPTLRQGHVGGRTHDLWPRMPFRAAGVKGVRPPAALLAGVAEVRGPCAPGTDGVCRSLASGQHRRADSRGEAVRGSRRSPAWPRGVALLPRGRCRSRCAPVRAPRRVPCERTVPGELSGGNWNGREGPAVRPRCVVVAGRFIAPANVNSPLPLRGPCPGGRVVPLRRRVSPPRAGR